LLAGFARVPHLYASFLLLIEFNRSGVSDHWLTEYPSHVGTLRAQRHNASPGLGQGCICHPQQQGTANEKCAPLSIANHRLQTRRAGCIQVH
jgi:hypothetical protein